MFSQGHIIFLTSFNIGIANCEHEACYNRVACVILTVCSYLYKYLCSDHTWCPYLQCPN